MLKIKGTVHQITPTEERGDKGFALRLLVIVDDPKAQNPTYAAFEAKRTRKGDTTPLLDKFREGESVEVSFSPEARAWQDPRTGKTRWFSSLALHDISRTGVELPQPAPPPETVAEQIEMTADDIPF